MTTPNLQLNEFGAVGIPSGSDISDSMRRLDAVVQLATSAFVSEPPAVPALGDRVIVNPPGTGVFTGHDLHIAYKTQSGWEFLIPEHGWLAFVGTPPILYAFDSSVPAWVLYEQPKLQNLKMTRTIGAIFTRGGAELTLPADPVYLQVPFSGTIVKVAITGVGGTGDAVIDIWKSTAYPPNVGGSIVGGTALPAISGDLIYQDTALVDWDTEVLENDWFGFNLGDSSVFTAVLVQLFVEVPL